MLNDNSDTLFPTNRNTRQRKERRGNNNNWTLTMYLKELKVKTIFYAFLFGLQKTSTLNALHKEGCHKMENKFKEEYHEQE